MSTRLNAREVLVAELLGEIDELVHRVERLSPALEATGLRLNQSAEMAAAAVERSAHQSRAVIDQAQKSAVGYIVRRTNETAAASLEQQRLVLESCARDAFTVQMAPVLQQLEAAASQAAQRMQRSSWSAWLEHAATASLAAAFSGALVLYLARG